MRQFFLGEYYNLHKQKKRLRLQEKRDKGKVGFVTMCSCDCFFGAVRGISERPLEERC